MPVEAHGKVMIVSFFNPNDIGQITRMAAEPAITELVIKGEISPDMARELENMLSANTTITSLVLSNEAFIGVRRIRGINFDLALALKSVLLKNKTVISLVLQGHRFGANGVLEVIQALKHNMTLMRLDWCWGGIGLTGAKAIATMLETNKTLRELDLRENKIEVDGAQIILGAFQTNVTLLRLGLDESSITPNIRQAITEYLYRNYVEATRAFEATSAFLVREGEVPPCLEEWRGCESRLIDPDILRRGWMWAAEFASTIFAPEVELPATSLRVAATQEVSASAAALGPVPASDFDSMAHTPGLSLFSVYDTSMIRPCDGFDVAQALIEREDSGIQPLSVSVSQASSASSTSSPGSVLSVSPTSPSLPPLLPPSLIDQFGMFGGENKRPEERDGTQEQGLSCPLSSRRRMGEMVDEAKVPGEAQTPTASP